MVFDISCEELNVKSFKVEAEDQSNAVYIFAKTIIYPQYTISEVSDVLNLVFDKDVANMNGILLSIKPVGEVVESEAPKKSKKEKVEEPVVEKTEVVSNEPSGDSNEEKSVSE